MTSSNSLTRKTLIGASWLVLWRFLTRTLGFGSTLVLARLLVPADFGLIAMASTFAAVVDALSQLGLQDALVRHPANDRQLFDTAFTLQVARAVMTSSIVALGAPVAAWWFNEPRLIPLLLVLAAASLVSGFENIGMVEFRREMRFDVQFRLAVASRLLQLATTIPLAFAYRSYWALMAGIVVSNVSRTVMTYFAHPYRPSFRLAGWRELASFSFWTWATCVASIVWDRCDPFVLGPVVGPRLLGIYLVALEMATLPVTELIAPASDALFTGFASAQKQGASSVKLAPSVAGALLLIIAPVVTAISCASGYVVAALLGPKWAEAQPLIAILAWLCLFSPFSWVCSAVLVANGYVRRNFIGNVIVSAVKLAVLLIAVSLTHRLDIIAAATAVCVAIESTLFMLLLRGTGEVRLLDTAGPLVRAILAGGAATVALQQAGLAWQPISMPSLPALLYCVLTGVIALLVFWPVDLLLWLVSGRPAGPEALLTAFTKRQVSALLARRLPPRSAG